MAKIIVDCPDPNNPKDIEKAAEEMVGKCNITYYRQAEQLQKKGKVVGDREASREIAKETGESEEAVRHRIRKGKDQVGPGGPEALTQSDQVFIIKQAKNIKTVRRKERKAKREQQNADIAKTDPPVEGAAFKVLDSCSLVDADIKPGSIDAIITDPPYAFRYLPLYEELSRKASEWLKPNAPCIVMIGQSWLELSLELLSKHLNYIWSLCYYSPGKSTQIMGRKIKSNWKPLIYLVNGKNEGEHINDWVDAGSYDKSHHDWGQTVEGMAQVVERFTVKNDVVLDPFCGSGTTGVASVKLDRYFIGIDSDDVAIKQARERLRKAENDKAG